jgi:hypothetical protein
MEMALPEFYQWSMTAADMLREEQAKGNTQEVGPGL